MLWSHLQVCWKLVNKQRKVWAAILVQGATSPHWVDPSCLLWRIMRVIFRGLEKRSIWYSTIQGFNSIIHFPVGCKEKPSIMFWGKEGKGHNNILDHFSYLQAPLGLFICFVSFLKLDFDYFLVYYNVNEEQNYLITGEGKRERESGRWEQIHMDGFIREIVLTNIFAFV